MGATYSTCVLQMPTISKITHEVDGSKTFLRGVAFTLMSVVFCFRIRN